MLTREKESKIGQKSPESGNVLASRLIRSFRDVPYNCPYVRRIDKEPLDVRFCLFSGCFFGIGRSHEGVSNYEKSEYDVRAGLYGFFESNRWDEVTD